MKVSFLFSCGKGVEWYLIDSIICMLNRGELSLIDSATGLKVSDDELEKKCELLIESFGHDIDKDLTGNERIALNELMKNKFKAVSRDRIRTITGLGHSPNSRSVDVIMSRLRSKVASIEVDGCKVGKIKSVRGKGYMLVN